ncbi:MAG: FAD:protein FMN transferase [Planctomycetota bacterium]
MSNRILFNLVFLMLLTPFPVVNAQENFTGKTMGPIDYQVTIYDDIDDRQKLTEGIQSTLDKVNRLMSTYQKDSDVSRFNRATVDQWIEVDVTTVTVIQRAIELSELTGGAFDITVGPAVNAWNFGPQKSKALPSDQEVAELQNRVGYEHIQYQANPPSLRKSKGRVQIDLSAIAKGFAADEVQRYLTDQQLKNFMVEVGGEVVVSGETAKGPWRIGIEKPVEMVRQVAEVVELTDCAMATSGDYRNFRMVDGERLSHTIDPKTCRPIKNPPASVSVVAPDCMTADAMATAIMVMGIEKGLKVCQENGLQMNAYQRKSKEVSTATKHTPEFPMAPLEINATNDEASIWPAFVGAMVIFMLAITSMAVGAIFNQKPIRGSCGGISPTASEDGSTACSLCSKPIAECPEKASATV